MRNPFIFETEPFEAYSEIEETRELSEEEVIDWLKDKLGLGKPKPLQKGVAKVYKKAVEPKIERLKQRLQISPEKVCWIQNVLNKAMGENLVADGIYGPLSRGAVRRFQARHALLVDGVVGPQTETALIQAALNHIAQASLVPINGVMDAKTRQEILRFQSGKSLVADGIVGPKTRAAMVTALGGQCIVRPPSAIKPRKPSDYYQVRPPKPGPCDPAVVDGLLKACEQDFLVCAGKCGLDYLIGRIKAVPQLASCARLSNPYAVVLCALARGGFDLIDDLIQAKACIETCASNRDMCRFNAERCARW